MRAGRQLEGYAARNGQGCYIEAIGLVENRRRSQPFVDTPSLEHHRCVLCADVV